ncbi:MAG TPA: DUF4870 domain-containing protein [Planctomycetes bacterium]|nr:DUF4870 domain-containing protein [Planctomycetota bacterium]HIN79868.1 DUF4870 domain-containing protein [Planctomycetota bacterium]
MRSAVNGANRSNDAVSSPSSTYWSVALRLMPLIPGWGLLLCLSAWLLGRSSHPVLDRHMKAIGNLLITVFVAAATLVTLFLASGYIAISGWMEFRAATFPALLIFATLLGGMALFTVVVLLIGAFHASNRKIYIYPLSFPFLGQVTTSRKGK